MLFGRAFVKRFALSYRTVVSLSCLSVCDVSVFWPGWMDQDATWYGGRPDINIDYLSGMTPVLLSCYIVESNLKRNYARAYRWYR